VKFLVGTTSANTLTVSIKNVTTATLLGTASAGVATDATALKAIASLSTAINTISEDRAKIGAYESQFNFSGQAISTNVQNTVASASTILDADVAAVKTQLSSEDVKTQASIAALTQASMLPQELLKLIQAA
jgi:flagellin